MADARLEDHGRWLALGGDYDPGALVFDWFNERQLADLAQSLGLNLELARQITRDKKGTDGLKVSLKVVELSGGNERGLAEAATHAGALPTATFIEIYVRLRRESRLQVLSKPSVDGPTGMLAACRSAASSDTWALIEGDWTVSHDPICLTLVRPAGASRDLEDGELRLEALIPAKPDELLPTGRVRLTPGLRLRATVFGQIESWIEQEPSLTLIAHAEFARSATHALSGMVGATGTLPTAISKSNSQNVQGCLMGTWIGRCGLPAVGGALHREHSRQVAASTAALRPARSAAPKTTRFWVAT